MWNAISAVMNGFNDFLWGWFMIILLLGTHIFLTIRTKFVQRKTFKAIKLSVTKDPDSDGDISPFQALATALASTIGTGNIIGVGTAIALGGPGAVLWCWLTGVFGIATKYSESLIGVKYRVKTSDGRMLGGAMYALERGFKFKTLGKILAVLFALFALLASFGIGSGVQVNAISNIMNNTFDLVFKLGKLFGSNLVCRISADCLKHTRKTCLFALNMTCKHRTAAYENCRNINSCGSHKHTRNILVAVRNHYKCVKRMSLCHSLC
jgi:Na+/alanine symporter